MLNILRGKIRESKKVSNVFVIHKICCRCSSYRELVTLARRWMYYHRNDEVAARTWIPPKSGNLATFVGAETRTDKKSGFH